MRRRLANEDADENKGIDPRIFFEGVNQLEAKDGHYVRHHGDDDDANSDAHGVARHSTENLTNDDIVDNCEATTHDDVENTTQLGTPEAEGVSRRSDLSHAELPSFRNTFRGVYLQR